MGVWVHVKWWPMGFPVLSAGKWSMGATRALYKCLLWTLIKEFGGRGCVTLTDLMATPLWSTSAKCFQTDSFNDKNWHLNAIFSILYLKGLQWLRFKRYVVDKTFHKLQTNVPSYFIYLKNLSYSTFLLTTWLDKFINKAHCFIVCL